MGDTSLWRSVFQACVDDTSVQDSKENMSRRILFSPSRNPTSWPENTQQNMLSPDELKSTCINTIEFLEKEVRLYNNYYNTQEVEKLNGCLELIKEVALAKTQSVTLPSKPDGGHVPKTSFVITIRNEQEGIYEMAKEYIEFLNQMLMMWAGQHEVCKQFEQCLKCVEHFVHQGKDYPSVSSARSVTKKQEPDKMGIDPTGECTAPDKTKATTGTENSVTKKQEPDKIEIQRGGEFTGPDKTDAAAGAEECKSACSDLEMVYLKLRDKFEMLQKQAAGFLRQRQLAEKELEEERKKSCKLQEDNDSIKQQLAEQSKKIDQILDENYSIREYCKNLVEEVKELERENNHIHEENGNLREKCKKMGKNLNAFKEANVRLGKDNESMSERCRDLREEVNQLEQKNASLVTRLSKFMGNQERERTDAHEDLCDQFRPSNIIVMLKDLYKKKYLDISEALEDCKWNEPKICSYLLDVLQEAYQRTHCDLNKFRKEVSEEVASVIKKKWKTDSYRGLPDSLLDGINEMMREQADSMLMAAIENKVLEVMKKKYGSFKDLNINEKMCTNVKEKLKVYISGCVKVTFLMNTCTPPMFIDCSDRIYDAAKHTKFEGKGNAILYFVWPCVYFSKGAFDDRNPVLEKGEVVTCEGVHQMPASRNAYEDSRHKQRQYTNEDEFHENRIEDASLRSVEEWYTPGQATRLIQVQPCDSETIL